MLDNRFSIDNKRRNVSLKQFNKAAQRLESSIRNVRPTITSNLFLTTSKADYYGPLSLTDGDQVTIEAEDRREVYSLEELDNSHWERSYHKSLVIRDPSTKDSYMIILDTEEREPKRLFFYGQVLDEKSQEIFDSFRKAGFFQEIGDGWKKLSDLERGQVLGVLSGKLR